MDTAESTMKERMISSNRDPSRSVDCFDQFMDDDESEFILGSEDSKGYDTLCPGIQTEQDSISSLDFEVNMDEDLILNTSRQDEVDSKVIQRIKAMPQINPYKRRVASKRQRKKLDDFSGWLWKKSANIFRGWQKRYVYLSQDRLCYYKTPDDKVPCGIINLSVVDAKVQITQKERLTFSILVDGCKRRFRFKAESQEQRNQWGSQIIKHM
jgi:hypothetical protein